MGEQDSEKNNMNNLNILTKATDTGVFVTASGQLFSKADKIALAVSYVIAFIYTYSIESEYIKIWLAVFTLLFCTASEILFRKEKASVESWIWLGSIAIITISIISGRNRVWGETSWLFMHAYAIYWILNRSGKMVEGKSSRFFLIDVIYGVFIIPFKNFFLRTRIIWSGYLDPARDKNKSGSKAGSLAAIAVAFILLIAAGSLLSQADQVFGRLLGDFLDRFDTKAISSMIFRIAFSLPVGAYLFGLVLGAKKEDRIRIVSSGESVNRQLESLRQVPAVVWNLLVTVFVFLYLVFFIVQGSYLFGAFTQTLPAEFTIADYARKGFFELCLIMALNFSLLWIVGRSSKAGINGNRFTKALSTLVLIESILFSATAFSKIYFYIASYGFTPLRWQSIWLVSILLVGCVSALISIWSGKQTSRYWLIFSGVSLALMHLY